MKRSEMIAKMKVTSQSFIGEYIGDDFEDRIIEALLTTCEDNGMLAPSYKHWNSKNPTDVNERNIPKDLEYDPHNGDYVNRWEKE